MKRAFGVAATIAAALTLGGSLPASAESTGEPILGPEGYKSLYIGQSGDEAEATGLLVDKRPGPCDRYYLHPDEGEQNVGSGVFIDPELGVVLIGGTTKSHTPEGIGMGSSLEEIRAAYPDLTPVPPTDYVYEADVPGFEEHQYRFAVDESDRVTDFVLHAEEAGQCLE